MSTELTPETHLDALPDFSPETLTARALSLPGPPLETAQRLLDLARDAYWKQKDLPRAIAFSQSALGYACHHANQSPDLHNQLLGLLKAAAYNLASFTWPGWDEPNITITPADQAVGREAAKINLHLAQTLNRPPGPLASAYWLFGAHELAAANYRIALNAFAEYRSIAPTDDHRRLADGYTAITLLTARRDDAAASAQFDAAVAALLALNTEDSKVFADQLRSVRAYFLKSPPVAQAST
jgi:hypothetical protein